MRVVVVDDSPVARTALRGMLEEAGFEVAEAEDGALGMQAVDSFAPDLVVTDMFMPGRIEGLELVRSLRRQSPGVKIIAISGGGANGRVDVLQTAKYLGADEILYKPFDGTRLAGTIRKVLPMSAPNSPAGEQ